jgi:hypothetical protein
MPDTSLRVITSLALALGIIACGGGGGSALELPTRSNPETNGGSDNGSNDDVTPTEPLAHCEDSGGSDGDGFFRNVTPDLGLCYDGTLPDSDPTEAEETAGGLALADIDNDGHPELYVAHGHTTPGRLFSFDGERFVERADHGIELLSIDLAGYFIDIDVDGFKDFVSVQHEGVEVFRNDGTGIFSEWTAATGIDNRTATWSMAAADYDVDGDLDLFFSHWGTGMTGGETEYLWNNNGEGVFTDLSTKVPIKVTENNRDVESEYSFTPTFADFNSDGYPDLLIASDWGASQVIQNIDGETFIDLTTDVISDENGMGSAVADYDRDGDLDWFVSSIWAPGQPTNDSGNRLYRNMDGQGTFEDVTDEAGVREGDWGWGSCFADFDNDGHVDLFHTNGFLEPPSVFHHDPSRLFMSNGDGTFTERAEELGITHDAHGRGIICTDYNDDGKVDIFIANNGTSPTVFMNNHQNDNHYVSIDLAGVGANPEAIGARVTVTTASGSQIDEVRLGTAYLSQGPATLHFGLGEDDSILSIDVSWPGPGQPISRVEMIDVDQRLTLTHP